MPRIWWALLFSVLSKTPQTSLLLKKFSFSVSLTYKLSGGKKSLDTYCPSASLPDLSTKRPKEPAW